MEEAVPTRTASCEPQSSLDEGNHRRAGLGSAVQTRPLLKVCAGCVEDEYVIQIFWTPIFGPPEVGWVFHGPNSSLGFKRSLAKKKDKLNSFGRNQAKKHVTQGCSPTFLPGELIQKSTPKVRFARRIFLPPTVSKTSACVRISTFPHFRFPSLSP